MSSVYLIKQLTININFWNQPIIKLMHFYHWHCSAWSYCDASWCWCCSLSNAQHHHLDLLHGRADAHHPFLLHLSVEFVQKVEVDAHWGRKYSQQTQLLIWQPQKSCLLLYLSASRGGKIWPTQPKCTPLRSPPQAKIIGVQRGKGVKVILNIFTS